MKMFYLICAVLLVSGCAHTGLQGQPKDAVYTKGSGCAERLLSNLGLAADFRQALDRAVADKALDGGSKEQLDSFVKAYLETKLKKEDVSESYESYLKCTNEPDAANKCDTTPPSAPTGVKVEIKQ